MPAFKMSSPAATGRCLACLSSGHRAFEVSGHFYARCDECGSMYLDPLPTEAELAKVYAAQNYYDSALASSARIVRFAQKRAAALRTLGVRNLLEIGCASGIFLDAAAACGIDAQGLEPGPSSEAAVRRGHRVIRSSIESLEKPPGAFDAVALWEVLEHLRNPLETLRQIASWLGASGYLALSTPSATGLPARLLGARFPMYLPPEHLCVYSDRGLRQLLQRAGFEVQQWSSFSGLGSTDLAESIARYGTRRGLPLNSLASIGGRAFGPVFSLMDRGGLGSEFEVIAVRARR